MSFMPRPQYNALQPRQGVPKQISANFRDRLNQRGSALPCWRLVAAVVLPLAVVRHRRRRTPELQRLRRPLQPAEAASQTDSQARPQAALPAWQQAVHSNRRLHHRMGLHPARWKLLPPVGNPRRAGHRLNWVRRKIPTLERVEPRKEGPPLHHPRTAAPRGEDRAAGLPL